MDLTSVGGVAIAVVGSLVAGAATWVGYRLIGKSFSRGVYTEETVSMLLKQGDVGDWNAFRRLNPNWAPPLKGITLDSLSLPEVDLRRADLSDATFRRSRMDGADFSDAVLANADFSGASLRRAVFDRAVLRRARFVGANLQEASLVDADLQDADLGASSGAPARQEARSISEAMARAVTKPEELSSLRPQEFERVVAEVLQRLGYRVTLPREIRDEGVDIVAVQETPIGPVEILVQVKRMSDPRRPVPAEAVRALAGLLAQRNANMGLLVTNGRFTAAAREFAEGHPAVRLVDGDKFWALLRQAV